MPKARPTAAMRLPVKQKGWFVDRWPRLGVHTQTPVTDDAHGLVSARQRRRAIRQAHVAIDAPLALPLARRESGNAIQQHGAPSGGEVEADGMF